MVALLCMGDCHRIRAQQVGVWYDSELQVNNKGKSNYVNMLYLSGDYAINPYVSLSAATLSIVKTRNESLADDLQGFSNIEADNVPLTLAMACIDWTPNDRHSLSVGIRNVNEDYFVSDLTSLYINSSCGIFPTLALNMDIANYPLASMGLHYAYTSEPFHLLASLYNGRGYRDLTGRENLWRFAPSSDGVFLITQTDYTHRGNTYYLGACHQSSNSSNASSAQTAIWSYTELTVNDRVALIMGVSHAFGNNRQCIDFFGIGGQYTLGSKSILGFYTDYARFSHDEEWATELTFKYNFTPYLSLQPAYHIIRHQDWQSVALIRLSLRL